MISAVRTLLTPASRAIARRPLLTRHQRNFHLSTTSAAAALKVDIQTDKLDVLHHELRNSDDLTARKLVDFTQKLHWNIYDSLTVYPWFQSENYEVGYIQLLLNSSLEDLNANFNEHPCYKDVYSEVLDKVDTLNAEQVAKVAIAFLAIGLPLEDPLIAKALAICQRQLDETDMDGLSSITTFARMMGRNGLVFVAQITDRASQVIGETPACCDLLEPILNVHNSIQLFSSDTLSDKFQDKFIKILEPHSCLLRDAKTMGSVLRGIRRFPLNKSEEQFQFRNAISTLVLETLRKDVDFAQLNHSNIGELCNNLQNSKLYYRDLAERFQERALELIANTDRIVDISNAMYAFHNKYLSRDSRRIIDSQIFKYMPDADVLILSNLADTLKSINCRNSDILDNFQSLILSNVDSLFIYITRLDKIVKHLSWTNFKSKKHEAEFMSILLNKLSTTQLGLATWCLTTVACYLLRNTKYTIEQVLYDKLLRIIPQCKIRDLYPILVAMNSAPNTITPSAVNQLYRLQTMIYENVAERMDTIDSLDLLSQIISEFVRKSAHPDTNIMEKLMNMYPKFSNRLTKPQYNKIIMIHSHLKYYNPKVLDDLCEFVLKRNQENASELNCQDLMKLMTLLNAVGYVPKHMTELRDILLNFFDANFADMEVDEIIGFVGNLASMQVFPEDIISDVFNMEFIQRVDQFLKANPEKRQQLEFQLMKLNRLVVIECPELDIPWFHDKYCQNNVVTNYDPSALTFAYRVSQSLTLLFGSQRYHKTWIYSPYYYHINFEVLLDEDGKAIEVTRPAALQPKVDQRVAIRCLVESNFCYNDAELNGFEKIKHRHLEMLGYKVVEIPYFEWNSMGMADEQSKVSYLRQKIFS